MLARFTFVLVAAAAVLASSLVGCAASPDVNGDGVGPHSGAKAKKKATAESADDVATDGADESDHADTAYTPVTTPAPAATGAALPPADPIEVTTPPVTTPPATTTPQTLAPPSSINVKWSKKSDTAEYSFDLVTKGGTLIGPCINSITVQKHLSQRFDGVCTDQNQTVAISDVGQVRVCWTEGGDWSKASCAAAVYDGTSSEVTINN